jgi:hypothetical membrane protein
MEERRQSVTKERTKSYGKWMSRGRDLSGIFILSMGIFDTDIDFLGIIQLLFFICLFIYKGARDSLVV